MLVQIVTENGQKKVIPLTADAGAGAPVGTIIAMYKKSSPSGYLYCDGSTFDETEYPLLYAYLGSNVLPDLREVGLKGAEKNTTYIFDSTETDPRTGQAGTQNHDVFTQGEFKDDQLQEHKHTVNLLGIGDSSSSHINTSGGAGKDWYSVAPTAGTISTGRYGDVTRGKSLAVYWYIKATSGLSENAQDNVVAQLNEERSYSTEEVNTGKKWIDGKPIYKKVFVLNNAVSLNAGSWATINDIDVSTFGAIVDATMLDSINYAFEGFYLNKTNENKLRILTPQSYEVKTIILEYTKTTD